MLALSSLVPFLASLLVLVQEPARPPAEAPAAAAPETKASLPEEWLQAFHWRSIGPANMGGRITDVAVHPTDPCVYWVATASGGLLKTTNNGVSYQHQFDREATVSIGAVAVAPSNPEVVWVGTGEANPRNSVSWGDGVYKSSDGGATWKNMGLRHSFQIGRIAIHPADENVVYVGALGRLWGASEERGLFKTRDGGASWEKILYVDADTGVIDLRLQPGSPDVLLAATYQRRRDGFDGNDPAVKWGGGGGLWRSGDGGATWERIQTGLPSGQLGRIGLDWYAADPNVAYAVIESDRITQEPEDAAFMGVNGEDAEVGARLTEVAEDGPAAAAGLQVGDVVVAVDDATIHSWDDLTTEIRKRLAGETVKVEVSRERKSVVIELTFTRKPSAEEDRGQRGGGGGAGAPPEEEGASRAATQVEGANEAVEARPGAPPPGPFHGGLGGQRENAQEQQGPAGHEYGGVYRSDDAGLSWKRINSLNPRPMYFSQIRVDPSDNNYLYVLGVSLYRSKDGGATFSDDGHSDDVHVDHHALWIDPKDGRHMILGNDGGIYVTWSRMEHWDHHNHVAIGQFYHVTTDSQRDYQVYGGLQDNGSWGGPHRSSSGRGPVNNDWISVGGGDGFVVRVDPLDSDQIYMESQNGAMGRYHLASGERGSARPRGERGTRYRFNWNTPFLLSSHNSRIHYSAGNYVFRSLDRGNRPQAISPEISRTSQGSATALAESPRDENVLYAGTDDGALWRTLDGGKTWEDLFALPDQEPDGAANIARGESSAAARPAVDGGGAGPVAGRGEGRGGMGSRLLELDRDGDGKVQRAEVPEAMARFFERADANGDDAVDARELEELRERFGGGGRAARDSGGAASAAAEEAAPSTETAATATVAEPAAAPQPSSTQEPPAAEPVAAEPAAAQEPAPAPPGPHPDALTGEWTARLRGEERSGGEGGFAMRLKLEESGRISGTVDSRMGENVVRSGRFDPASGKLDLELSSDFGEMKLEATVQGESMSGRLSSGGRFQMDFEAAREAPLAAGQDRRAEQRRRQRQDDPDRAGHEWRPLGELLPRPMWVSGLVASRHKDSRVYLAIDGHRSDDDRPYVFLSEDHGSTWRSLRANLPDAAGSVRVIVEDHVNPNLLLLGSEFAAWVSVDRGASWTKFNSDLPTVAVHGFALHPKSGDVVAGTHGRSLWITDITPLRQMNEEVLAARAHLFDPADPVLWRSSPSRGDSGPRGFTGENPETGVQIWYLLREPAQRLRLRVTDPAGELVRELDAPPAAAGLQRVTWDLRPQPREGGGQGGGRRGRFARRVDPGSYVAVLEVDGTTYRQAFEVAVDPGYPDPTWLQYEHLGFDFLEADGEEELRPEPGGLY